MEMKDVLHYYLGHKCKVHSDGKKLLDTHIIAIHTNGNIQTAHSYKNRDQWHVDEIKLCLKRLSDMSFEEIKAIQSLPANAIEINKHIISGKTSGCSFDYKWVSDKVNTKDGFSYSGTGIVISSEFTSNQFHYLLKQGFDLFNLIDSGQAIDAKTVK